MPCCLSPGTTAARLWALRSMSRAFRPTAEGRFAVAQRIVEEADKYGIPRSDIFIDCLVMAASTNQAEVVEILRAITMVKKSALACARCSACRT